MAIGRHTRLSIDLQAWDNGEFGRTHRGALHLLGPDFPGKVELVYNPEFLREASAVADYFAPPKIVIGTLDGRSSAAMDALHEGIEAPVFHVGIREAELTKFVDNTWHATKVAFANEIGRVCQNLGVSADQVHRIFVSDTKLNLSAYYTRPGGPFGGSCLPKDVRALEFIARESGSDAKLVSTSSSPTRDTKTFNWSRSSGSSNLRAKVLLAGLAFKAGTDDASARAQTWTSLGA